MFDIHALLHTCLNAPGLVILGSAFLIILFCVAMTLSAACLCHGVNPNCQPPQTDEEAQAYAETPASWIPPVF